MRYAPLRTMNPTDNDLTVASSIWLASRIPAVMGAWGGALPNFRVVGDSAMRTFDSGDFLANGMQAVGDANIIVNRESTASQLIWRGLWADGNYIVVGRGHSQLGLICPFNGYNVGYRYRNGWRTQRVD